MNDAIWFLFHFVIAIFSLNKNFLQKCSPLLFVFMVLFYFLVPFDGDRENYYRYFENLDVSFYVFEPGFYIISKILYAVYPSKYFIYFMIDCLIFLILFISFKNFERELSSSNNLANMTISLMIVISVFYFLASQNVIRQGLSLAILALSLSFYFKGLLKSSLILSIVAISIHSATPIFVVSFVFLSWAYKFSLKVRYALTLIFSISSYVFVIKYLEGSSYVDSSFEWAGDRISSEIKVVVLWVSVIVTNILLSKFSSYDKLIWLRTSFLIFLTPFSLNGEIFARLAVGLYLLDMFLTIFVFAEGGKNRQIATLCLVLSAGIAPNVLGLIL